MGHTLNFNKGCIGKFWIRTIWSYLSNWAANAVIRWFNGKGRKKVAMGGYKEVRLIESHFVAMPVLELVKWWTCRTWTCRTCLSNDGDLNECLWVFKLMGWGGEVFSKWWDVVRWWASMLDLVVGTPTCWYPPLSTNDWWGVLCDDEWWCFHHHCCYLLFAGRWVDLLFFSY